MRLPVFSNKKNVIVSDQIAQDSKEELFSVLSEETVTFIMEVRSCKTN